MFGLGSVSDCSIKLDTFFLIYTKLMDLIESLNWRYATKRMTGEKISEKDLNIILEAIRLTPTAYGLQPFKVIVTEDKALYRFS